MKSLLIALLVCCDSEHESSKTLTRAVFTTHEEIFLRVLECCLVNCELLSYEVKRLPCSVTAYCVSEEKVLNTAVAVILPSMMSCLVIISRMWDGFANSALFFYSFFPGDIVFTQHSHH